MELYLNVKINLLRANDGKIYSEEKTLSEKGIETYKRILKTFVGNNAYLGFELINIDDNKSLFKFGKI